MTFHMATDIDRATLVAAAIMGRPIVMRVVPRVRMAYLHTMMVPRGQAGERRDDTGQPLQRQDEEERQ